MPTVQREYRETLKQLVDAEVRVRYPMPKGCNGCGGSYDNNVLGCRYCSERHANRRDRARA